MRPSVPGLAVALLVTILGSAFCQMSSAQSSGTGTIVGRVTEPSGAPLADATVRLFDVQPVNQVRTNANGEYRMTGVPAGSQRLSVTGSSGGTEWRANIDVEVIAGQEVRADALVAASADPDRVIDIFGEPEDDSEKGLEKEIFQGNTVGSVIGGETLSVSSGIDQAVSRAPGVTVQDNFVYVRGLGERYSQTLFDGRSLPSPEPERKAIPLDLFPKELIDSLVVVKSYRADLPGEFAGGSLQMSTIDVPDKSFFSVDVSFKAVDGSSFNRFNTYKGGKYDRFTIADSTRELPDAVPSQRVPVGLTDAQRQEVGRSFSDTWEVFETVAPLDLGLGTTFGARLDPGAGSLGVIGSLNWSNKYRNIEDEERRFLESPSAGLTVYEFEDIDSSTFSAEVNGLLNVVYQLNPGNQVGVRNFMVRSTEDRVQLKATRDFENERDEREIDLQYVERRLYNTQFFGEHLLVGDSYFEWRGGYSRVERDEPDHKNIRYIREFGDPEFELGSGLEGNSRQFLYLAEDVYDVSVDFTIPFAPFFGDPFGLPDDPETVDVDLVKANQGFTIGAAWLDRDREFESRTFTYLPGMGLDGNGDPIDLTLPPEELFVDDHISPSGFLIRESTESTDAYDATETNAAVYGMFDFRLSRSLRLNAGVRVEQNEQEVVTTQRLVIPPQQINAELDDTDVLPSFTLTWEFADDHQIRIAGSQTVNRPTLRELSPVRFQNTDGFRAQGNADLERALLRGADLRYEFSPSFGELFAVGVFYKTIDDPIERVTFAVSEISVDSFENAKEATLYGIEFELRKKLSFISNALSNFEVKANFSRIESEVEIELRPVDQQTNDNRPLQGQPLYTANLGLFYSNVDRGLTFSVLANTFGERISRVGKSGVPDEKEQPRIDLTVGFSKTIGDGKLSVRLENLLDDEFKFETGGFTTRKFKRGMALGVSYSIDF